MFSIEMIYIHKMVHPGDRDEIWTRTKTNDILNPDSNDPATAKAIVEYVEEKMKAIPSPTGVTTEESVDNAIAAQATGTTDEIRTAIEGIPAPIPEKVKTWIALQCLRPEPIENPINTTDFDVSRYCITQYQNLVMVNVWLVYNRDLRAVYEYDQVIFISEINEAILKPIVDGSVAAFPFMYRDPPHKTNGSYGLFEFVEYKANKSYLKHSLDWKYIDNNGTWEHESSPEFGSVRYYGRATAFNVFRYAYFGEEPPSNIQIAAT